MARITLDPVPWWLVPNVLALDAPLVAVVCQRFLAGRFGVPVPAAATLALAAVVWAGTEEATALLNTWATEAGPELAAEAGPELAAEVTGSPGG